MHSSDLFLFRAKKAISNIWSYIYINIYSKIYIYQIYYNIYSKYVGWVEGVHLRKRVLHMNGLSPLGPEV